MSQATPIGLSGPVNTDVRAAIARASQATGVDFDYLLAQAKIESSLNPQAKAGTSSAAGLYQFTGGTWLQTLDRHGEQHGLDWASAAIDGGKVDPQMRAQIMAMRFDPNASALMAAELANDNKTALTSTLGREPDAAELYMAHFLGADGAAKFLSALQSDPTQSAAAILPKAAAANHGIFYDASGPRSVSGVMELMRGKVSNAMNGAGPMPAVSSYAATQVAAVTPTGGPLQREFNAMAAEASTRAGTGADSSNRTSMADTLRSAFGAGGSAAQNGAPDFVRTAYAKLQAFNL
ncbi:MAG: transglycosylase [Novosphingobium sp.]|nr:transglycosylase [Novosphingobium sp.]